MRILPFCLIVLLAACSDYNLNGKAEGNGDGEHDSAWDGEDDGDDGGYPEDTDPDVCEGRSFPGKSVRQNDECDVEAAPVGSFTPVVEWKKDTFANAPGSNQIMMMPAVGSLSDDDGDGDADENDVPDVVVVTYGSTDVVRVVSGDGSGTELLTIQGSGVQGQGGVALGDLDNDGWTDIVFATNSQTLVAYDHNGARMWTSASLSGSMYGISDNPAIADLNGDGEPEVICGSAIVSNTGATLGQGRAGMGGVNGNNVGTTSFAYDIDNDGDQEVVVGNALYKRNGSAIWTNGQEDGYPAVGNFDGDDKGEIVVSTGGRIRLQDDDGTVLCTARIPGADSAYYGGPPTVADFDGDGEAEFAAAAGSRYSVFEKDCSVKWQAVTQDASSGNTGSAVFDFEGDGIAEAVYADETRLWVFAGPDGSVKLESTEHSNATWLEYPAIADVDADGQAEIIVANTSGHSGFYVFGDADGSWRSARPVWNQHAYSITNVNDDGSIPASPARNLETYNNFRSGDIYAGSDGYTLPDLTATVEGVCLDECDDGALIAWVSVANRGYEDITQDFVVSLIAVDDDGNVSTVGSTEVTDTVPAGESLDSFEYRVESGARMIATLTAEVDGGDGGTDQVVSECLEDNNEDEWKENLCTD
ncbi:MAG: VCBS repeat-containing protein [Myxococcales bacterium]|nr:VCBS repeat-containing protein [Myxococcales bacterium]